MIYILLTLILIILLTYFIGGYFLRYALVPNSGAENRIIKDNSTPPDDEQIEPQAQMLEDNMVDDIILRDAWMDDMAIDQLEVSIQSHDGFKLSGHAFKQDSPTNRWVIACHGYQSGEGETLLIGRHFYDQGYNVLTVSMRAHGKSEGDYIGMGYLDKDDLLSWTNALVAKYPSSEIAYHGTSMGGATVLMASGLDLPSNVKAIVSDCAFTGVWEIFAAEMKQRFNIPPFPILHMARIMGKIKAGFDIKDGRTIDYVRKSTLPILFIHTVDDDFVPLSMMHDLYEAKVHGDKEAYIVEVGGHAEAKYAEPVRYYEKVFSFLNHYLSKKSNHSD